MVFVQGITIKKITSAEKMEETYNQGNKMRSVASTDMNAHSSRSHMVFSILIKTKNLQTDTKAIGKVQLFRLIFS